MLLCLSLLCTARSEGNQDSLRDKTGKSEDTTFNTFAPLLIPHADTLKKTRDTFSLRKLLFPDTCTPKKTDSLPAILATPFFSPHALKVFSKGPLDRKKGIHDWAFTVLVISFLLYAGVQFRQGKRLTQIYRAFLASRFLSQMMRGTDLYKERITYNLFMIFLLATPLFLYELNVFYGFYPVKELPWEAFILYLEIFLLNAILYYTKVLVIRMAGVIFKTTDVTAEYFYTLLIFSLIQGLLMLVITSIVVFTGSLLVLQAGTFFVCLIYAYQLLRGFFIGLKNSTYSFFYLVLFFFTIEIMPLLVIVKLLHP